MPLELQQQTDTQQHSTAKSRKKLVIAICSFLLLLVLSYALTGAIAAVKLNNLRSTADVFTDQLVGGDTAAIQQSAHAISSDIHTINFMLGGPQWALASLIPGIGSDITNARSLVNTADKLCGAILDPTVEGMVAQDTGPLLLEGKRINARALHIATDNLANASDLVHEQAVKTAALPTCSISKLNAASNTVSKALNALDIVAQNSSSLAPNIEYLLGAENGPRKYLLIALNAAELRSVGGLPGSYGTLTVDNGKISVEDFLSLQATERLVPNEEENIDTTTIAPGLTDEEQILFGRRVVNVPAETATNPQFSRFAESFSYLYTLRGHGDVDGVVAMDLVFFESILAITGSITTSAGIEVNSENASQLLLHDSYAYMKNAEQDAFFSEVANTCFDSFFSNLNGKTVLQLFKSIWYTRYTRHLQTWFPNDELEQAFLGLGFGGEIAGTEEEPYLGVFVNDDTWSKVSWYLDINTTIGEGVEKPDGSKEYLVTTTISNHLYTDEANELRDYVTGFNWRKRSRTDMLDWVFIYAPLGGSITFHEEDAYFTPLDKTRAGFNGIEEVEGMNKASHLGHEVWFAEVQIFGGETVTLTYTVTTSPKQQYELSLQQTPTATTW